MHTTCYVFYCACLGAMLTDQNRMAPKLAVNIISPMDGQAWEQLQLLSTHFLGISLACTVPQVLMLNLCATTTALTDHQQSSPSSWEVT